ncbi:MAG: acylphosphatase [Thermoanaerobaculia bacterium]
MSGWDSAARLYEVSGRVQGVGYRAFATRVARALGLRGGAANLPNGHVRLWVEGPEHALERFEAALHEGPRSARVDVLEKKSIDLSLVTPDTYDVEF